MRTLFFLFLFSFVLHSASIDVISSVPSGMTAGSIYLIDYNLCLNTAQNYTLNFNMTNTTYEFSSNGTEFNFTGCSYNSTSRLYVCPLYGNVGTNKILINMSIDLFTRPEEYIRSGFIEFLSEAEFGVCNPVPVIAPAPSSSGGSSSGSGGGSFAIPRPAYKLKEPDKPKPEPPKEVVVVEEPKEIPIEIPKENVTKNVTEPKTILIIPADEVTNGITEQEPVSFPWDIFMIFIAGVVGIVIFGIIFYSVKTYMENE